MTMMIRSDQMDSFQESIDQQLAADVKNYLVAHQNRLLAATPPETIDALIAQGMQEFHRLNLIRTSSLYWLVATMMRIGPRFHHHPVIGKLLADETVPPEKRIAWVLDNTTIEHWDEAAMIALEG